MKIDDYMNGGSTGRGQPHSAHTTSPNRGPHAKGIDDTGHDTRGDARKHRDSAIDDSEAVSLAADWADISQGLKKDLGPQLHSQWIKPIQVGTFCKETGTLDLFLPTEFSANWVSDRFADRLSLAWKIARSEVRQVRISVHPRRRAMPDLRLPGEAPANAPRMAASPSAADALAGASSGLDPSLTFAEFVSGTGNVLAVNAAQRMAAIETPSSHRSTSKPRPARARPTCSTPSATPMPPPGPARASSTARPNAS